MAKVMFTAIVAEITGRLAGSVFQKSVGGYQLHTVGLPINRRTGAQQLNRVTFEFLASHWQTLTDEQKLSYPGATNQQRFTSYISYNFRYAWQSGALVPEKVTKTAADMPNWYVGFSSVSGGTFNFGAGDDTEGSYSIEPGDSTLWFRDFTPPGTPNNGTWRAYRVLEQIIVEEGQTGFSLTSQIFPAIVPPPVGWQSEFYWHYETSTQIGTTNVIPFTRQS